MRVMSFKLNVMTVAPKAQLARSPWRPQNGPWGPGCWCTSTRTTAWASVAWAWARTPRARVIAEPPVWPASSRRVNTRERSAFATCLVTRGSSPAVRCRECTTASLEVRWYISTINTRTHSTTRQSYKSNSLSEQTLRNREQENKRFHYKMVGPACVFQSLHYRFNSVPYFKIKPQLTANQILLAILKL